MTALAKPLPDDPQALKALLLAERAAHAAETERLKQIIKELQRHRFGRSAESLPIDQLERALEEVQQTEAEHAAEAEATDAERRTEKAAKRRANRGSLPPQLVDVEDKVCPCCAAPCTGSAKASPSGWMSSRLSSGCWLCAGRSTPAAPARRWWSRSLRRTG